MKCITRTLKQIDVSWLNAGNAQHAVDGLAALLACDGYFCERLRVFPTPSTHRQPLTEGGVLEKLSHER